MDAIGSTILTGNLNEIGVGPFENIRNIKDNLPLSVCNVYIDEASIVIRSNGRLVDEIFLPD